MSAHERVREKGPLGTGSGAQPRTSCHCSLLPWLQVSCGPSGVRRFVPVGEEEEMKGVGVLTRGKAQTGSFITYLVLLIFWAWS